ncbi:2Fe-2S iron-sulfur cluster binding domain-containing protein [Deinococcus sp. HMF7620]|uniref:2Fe-2S iron-sulfur cluster binding domain-containing protein n=1 Tax=Deinococcus arboris TaxID=2682977 RepID=A0A7C9HPJ4_9DEIO|nr:2Fe-2S iron-sulfur cluster-binding protein [Deinococcus arboris]MVN85213.1 2Fe-2S iron-sulfur cluster binding domain-containing protein [Deinococcus arboris]
MTQVLSIQVSGYGEIQAQAGERLVLALERGGVDILHRCGGVARCTTCRVTFEAGEPDAMTAAEYDKLQEKNLLDSARLSCQIECAAGMSVTPLQTARSSGLEPGKAPAEQMEPEPVWTTRPGASTEG